MRTRPITEERSESDLAYGGVLVNDAHQILLREPAGQLGVYIWTFAEGGTNADETPQQAALREVLEGTGYFVEILGEVEGRLLGAAGATSFCLMRAFDDMRMPGSEAAQVRWVSFAEARELVKEGKPTFAARDLAILDTVEALVRSGRA
jgi:ADP-ribose pyrophosphatase YjhB (NUDIX family)